MLTEENDISETIFVCEKSVKKYSLWNSRKKILENIKREEIKESLKIGSYYKRLIHVNKKQIIIKYELLPEAYETIVISLLDKIIVIVKAPVFIGTCFNGQRKSVGYSDFFGRVFFDTSTTALKIEKFKTYLCVLYYDPQSEFECVWRIKQVICLSKTVIKYYLIDCKIPESIDEDKIICTKNNIRVQLEKSDFRETLTKEAMITSLPVYTIAFKTEPLHYICCYATLTNDFGEDLEKNAMIINERTGCCDEFAEERIFNLNKLCHDPEFLANLRLNPELEERILALMLDL